MQRLEEMTRDIVELREEAVKAALWQMRILRTWEERLSRHARYLTQLWAPT